MGCFYGKNGLREVCMGAGAFLLTVLAGFLLLCLVYALPADRVQLHVRESGEAMAEDGLYRQMVSGKDTTKLDNFTDALMMLTAAYGGDEGLIDRAVNNYELRLKDKDLIEVCRTSGLEQEPETVKRHAYARYWHGYLIVLKPLLTLFNLNEIRDLNVFVILLYLCATCVLLWNRRRGRYIVPYLLACSFVNPMTVSASLQFSTVFHVTSIAVLVLLLFWNRRYFREHVWLYFLIAGMMVSYVDLLTYPVVALAFPLIVYVALCEPDQPVDGLKKLIGCSALWCVGYVGMWASKWALSTILMRKNYFVNAMNTVKLRSGDTVFEQKLTSRQVIDGLTGFLRSSSLKYVLLLVVLTSAFLLMFMKIRWSRLTSSVLMLLAACYPFIWYAGTKNHSAIHGFYTYRGLSVFLFGTAACLMPLMDFGSLRKFRIQRR